MKNITVRLGTKCEVSIGNETIDISRCYDFRTIGNVHGLIRPNKELDRVSSVLIAELQKRGMFTSETGEVTC